MVAVEISHKKSAVLETSVTRFGDRAFHASHLRMHECMLITTPQVLALDFSAAAVLVQGDLIICFFFFLFSGECVHVCVRAHVCECRCKCAKLGKLLRELS